jgi:hypothetical protein
VDLAWAGKACVGWSGSQLFVPSQWLLSLDNTQRRFKTCMDRHPFNQKKSDCWKFLLLGGRITADRSWMRRSLFSLEFCPQARGSPLRLFEQMQLVPLWAVVRMALAPLAFGSCSTLELHQWRLLRQIWQWSGRYAHLVLHQEEFQRSLEQLHPASRGNRSKQQPPK